MEKRRRIPTEWINLIFGILIFFGLYLTSLYSYLLFHSLAEMFSIVIACGIFMVAWNSRRFLDNNYLLFIGIAYLFVGGLDLIHTIAYKGMGVFRGYETNPATQLWIIARYTESLSLLLAPLFLRKKLRIHYVFSVYLALISLLLMSIFYWEIFPVCFIEEVGLTPFKKISEYIISLILLASALLLLKHQREFDRKILQWIFWSILLTIGSELAFTFYIHAYGFSNLIGHYFKIASFYLIYKALIETGLIRPYDLLFRNLKQSEVALRHSEKKFSKAFHSSPNPMAIASLSDGRYHEVNESFLRLTGYSRGEVTGRTSIEINFWASPEDRTRMKEVVGKKGWIRNQEYTFRKKSGDGFTGLISAEVIEIDEEPCILSVINDITDRKRMEEELCKSRDELEMRVQQRTAELAKANELLERMFSSIDVLIAYMDKDFNFIRVNRAYADADEREPEFYVGKNHFVLFPNEENEAIFKKVVETGEPYSVYAKPFEYAEHPERGVTHWDWNLQPVKELDGSVGGVVLSMVNVTERIRAQEAVSAERQRLNDVLEVLPAYVVLLTPDHHVVFANRFFRDRFGESHGKRCFEYLFGYSGPCEICETYTVLKTGAPHQWEWTGPDGRIYDVFDFPFTDSDGSALILEMGIDITERREIEKQTNATNALLMLFTQKTTRKAYLDALVDLIHDWSKCRCVGIRVRNGQGFIPYESYIGFSEDFRKSEDWLSIDQNQCACIRVVKGKLDPQDASVMTPAGSFRCNNTLKFIENLSDEEKARYRGVCIEAGFMTVAVIPIRYRDEIIGAIHLADERPEMVPSRMIDFIETMTPLPGEAIHRFNLESELHRNYETQKAINSLLRLSLGDIPLEEFLEGTLDMLISNPWFSPAAKGCLFLAEPHREVLSMKAQYGLPDPIRQRCAQVPFGTCLCGKVALTKKIQYTDYLNDRHDFTFEEATPHSHYHVPILFGERILGLITLYLNEADRPGREKEDFLTAVAHTLASIIVRKKWEEALQESETRLRRLSSQLLTAQEDERRQIARDLHDGVGQMLTALKFKIEDLLERGDPKNVGANAESLESVIPIIRESIEEVRRIQMDLRPSTLDDLGVVATLRWFCREFEKIYSTFHIEKRMDVKENDIPDHLKTVIYRIIQEAMNNIAKHSKANVICLSLEKRGDRIELKVKDNGIGFDPAMARKGFGLGSMRERTEFSGGTFEIESAISAGTKIRASWTI